MTSGVKISIKAVVGSIVDEVTEGTITMGNINVLPYYDYDYEEGNVNHHTDYFYGSLESNYGFTSEIWDFSTLDPESNEPLKLK